MSKIQVEICRADGSKYPYIDSFGYDSNLTYVIKRQYYSYLSDTMATKNDGLSSKVLGIAHGIVIDKSEKSDFIMYFNLGKRFNTKEEWFESLEPEERREAIWNLNE